VSAENVEIVRALYTAYLRGDGEAARAAFHPDVEWDARHQPEGRIYRGHAGIREFFRNWRSIWDHTEVQPEEFLDAGDQVLVITRETTTRGGLEITEKHAELYTLREGLVVRWRGFSDPADGFQTAGLPQ
jgi:ketosteroid isomerase-like protein